MSIKNTGRANAFESQ